MKKKLLSTLAVLALTLPLCGGDSIETETYYVRNLWTAYTPSGSDKFVDIEMPAWATGFFLMAYVNSCTGCGGDWTIRTYFPGTSTEVDLIANLGAVNATGWFCSFYDGSSIDLYSTGCTDARIILPPGTLKVGIDVTAGTMSSIGWIRYVGNPK